MTTAAELDNAKIQKLETELDPEMRFRPLLPAAGWLVAVWLFGLSCFHYYTAGFGLLPETLHRGIHISCVLGLIFLVFSWSQKGNAATPKAGLFAPLGIGIVDWLCAIAAVVTSLYVPYVFHDLQFRVGNPDPIDWIMGTIMIVVLLEATRRSVGWPLPIIAIVLMIYALYGRSLPGILAHPGNTWKSVVNHLYLTSQGIYGIALGVVATYVFHYVLFGVLATRVGLGRFFIDLATAMTGRFSGGPAKVSIFGSALFGMISGSSVANVVTTGTFTIPLMKRVGYPAVKAGAIECAAGVNGQLMPPVMGAAAFLMAEYVGVSYAEICKAALLPAILTYGALFYVVDLEAVKAGMTGLPRTKRRTLKEGAIKALITISSLIILSCAIYYGLGWTKDVFGESASWLAVAVLIVSYVALVRTRAKHPDLPLDDPTKQLILVPDFYESARTGLHYLLPVVVLIWCLIVEEMSPGLAAFWGVIAMAGVVLTQHPLTAFFRGSRALAPEWRPLFATAFFLGLRRGELLALQKEAIDLRD